MQQFCTVHLSTLSNLDTVQRELDQSRQHCETLVQEHQKAVHDHHIASQRAEEAEHIAHHFKVLSDEYKSRIRALEQEISSDAKAGERRSTRQSRRLKQTAD